MLVATHNMMQGLFARHLLPSYARLHRERGVGVLCLQECSSRIAAQVLGTLGSRFCVLRLAAAPELAVVYDRTRLRPRRSRALALPRLTNVPLWQRVYTSGSPQQRWALVARFALRRLTHGQRRGLTVANFHLDAAGDIPHRERQMRALAHALPVSRRAPLVACGDTNAFTWRVAKAEPALARVLRPVAARHAARDARAADCAATHFMSRAREPKLGHRIAVVAGQFGVDLPRRYDVVCASAAVVESGVIDTPASDHNLVWARVRL
eukprot:scaffold5340_cov131-Isochrysis_galbana.AAC.8